MNNPCYRCPTRALGCHGTCEEYKEYRKSMDEENLRKRIENEPAAYRRRRAKMFAEMARKCGFRKGGTNNG